MLCVVLAALTALPATAAAHGGNPDFRSEFRAIQPAVRGLTVQILNYDDRLLLINRTGRTVVLEGYEREPYARLLADGTVEVNRRSPSYFLNEERYGAPVPGGANADAAPRWSVVSKTGRFESHDHRIHWMSKDTTPPQVKDEGKRTKVFDWRVPIEVGSRHAAVTGTLYWVPASSGGVPAAAIVALVVLVVLTVVLYLVTRRVRARSGKASEAWK
jgi:hypothetical protein